MTEVREWSRADTARLLRAPSAADDKYSRGVVGLRTGSDAYPGAAVLSVEGAWRSGAGFVRFTGEARAAEAVLARRPETVVSSSPLTVRVGAWVIGSGTDAAERTLEEEALLREILAGSAPVVVDAGALDLLPSRGGVAIATPHAGELARMRERAGLSPEGDIRTGTAELAALLGATIVRKGAQTLIAAPDAGVIGVEAGTGWLSTAGTGDVLAGVIGTLLAANPGAPAAEAAAAGVWLHGYAARIASGTAGGAPGHPILAVDVAEALPEAIGDLLT